MSNYILRILFLIANKIILVKWRTAKPPNVSQWGLRLKSVFMMERTTATLQMMMDIFERRWTQVSQYLNVGWSLGGPRMMCFLFFFSFCVYKRMFILSYQCQCVFYLHRYKTQHLQNSPREWAAHPSTLNPPEILKAWGYLQYHSPALAFQLIAPSLQGNHTFLE